jgi:LysR family transcriptional regulator, chromosome initiation inhibitor
MSLDLAQLTAFATVVEEGSFDAAARRLHVTPSAISQRIKALEAQTGQILVRRGRPCRATDAGQALVRLAGQIALLETEALAALNPAAAAGADARLHLPIAVNADSLATWFLPALAALPAATFDIRQEDQDHSVALLRDGSVMAAVTTEPRAVQGCRVQPLGSMRYLAVASPDFHHRYFPDGPTPDALASAPMLEFNRKDALQSRFARDLAGRRVDPPVTYLPTSVGFVDAARLGLAWGMVPERLGRAGLHDASLREIAPGRTLDVPLYWQRWRLDSPTLDTVTDAVRTAAAAALRPSDGIVVPT